MSRKPYCGRLDVVLRALPAAAVFLVPVFLWRQSTTTMLPKAVLLVVLASVGIGVAAAWFVARGKFIRLPAVAVAPVLIFTITLIIATANAPVQISAWLGPEIRSAGLWAYLASIVLFLITVGFGNVRSVLWVVVAALAATTVTAVVGALQLSPVDLGAWSPAGRSPLALLGNTNFSSALLGMGAPLAVWACLFSRWVTSARVAFGLLALLSLVVAWLSGSLQGPVVAVVGMSVLGVAATLEYAKRPLPVIAAVGSFLMIGGLTLVYGVATGLGPLGWTSGVVSLGPRLWYWEAAWNMFVDHPVLGVGLGMYPDYYTMHRTIASVQDLPTGVVADSPHSVPLAMLSEGGLILAAAYLGFIVAVMYLTARGLFVTRGPERLLLGAVAGTWLAYQFQSLISIEVPPLMVWHFVFAGAAILLANPRILQASQGSQDNGNTAIRKTSVAKSSRRRSRRKGPVVSLRCLAATVVGAVIAVPLMYLALVPLRADIAYARGEFLAFEHGDWANAQGWVADAISILPLESRFWVLAAVIEGSSGDVPASLDSLAEATARNPYDRAAAFAAARTHSELGDPDDADMYFRKAVELDPLRPDLLLAAGQHFLGRDDATVAVSFLTQATTVDTASADAWFALSEAYADIGRTDSADWAAANAERLVEDG